jgi:trehalose/maltose hydrolase-like predicted phosphorylase
VGYSVGSDVVAGDTVVMNKYVAVLHSSHYPYKKLPELSCEKALEAKSKSWDMLLNENSEAWSELWKKSNFMLSGNLNVQRKAINDEFKHIQFSLEKQI